MSDSHWRNIAGPIIAKVIAEHRDKSDSEIRLALREAYPFGERKYHPYKIWLDEIGRQLGTKPKLGSRVNVYGKVVAPNEPDPNQGDLFA